MNSFRDQAGRIARLARKELSESLRDRRTIITLVLMPILLYPILTIAFQQLLLSSQVEKAPTVYRIAFVSAEEAESVLSYWNVGRRVLLRRGTNPTEKDETIVPPPHLTPFPVLRDVIVVDPAEEVRQGKADVGVRLKPPGPFQFDPRRLLFIDCELIFREDSAIGREAAQHLEVLTAGGNYFMMTEGLRLIKVRQRGDPVRISARTVEDSTTRRNPLLPTLVPLILILMTITGAVYPAIDLTAGERERGTLEILVAAPIPRLSVLFAKYVAVMTVAVLTALVNLGAMTTTLYATGIGKLVFGTALTPVVIGLVFGLLLLFAAFFSAVLLAVTSFARSFKEAQAYLIPLMLLALTPGVLGLMPGLTLRGPLAIVPLLNIVLLARDLFEGNASWTTGAVVVVTTLLYAVAAVSVAARVFGTEAVLSSEQSGWADFLRRPRESRAAATPSSALLCLALMFPGYFLLTSGLAQIPGLSVAGKLGVMVAANLLLFGGFPLASAWMSRVRFVPGFQLGLRSWQGIVCAALLGFGLWPFVHELILLLRQVGFASLRPEVLERVRDALTAWREMPAVAVVGALAVVPALVEELFFRGYLFASFRSASKHAGTVVGLTAVLFALFHLLVTDSLAIERLPSSLLLGLILGVLAWKSASIWPGVVMHVLHNGTIVLLGYYQPWLESAGWVTPGAEHLPWQVLAGAGGMAVLGLLWLALLPTREEPS